MLAIDEAHLLEDEETLAMLQMLVDNTREGSQVVLAARRGPALPLARLRVSRDATELGPTDLRFDVAEVLSVMSSLGVEAPRADAATVAARTEGWPVAVYLAAQAVRNGGDIGELSAEDRVIADYLRREFLDAQPRAVKEFLVDTAVLTELSGPLCDFVLERTGSSALIDQIQRATLLLVPLDRDGSWFRYHRLLRRTLQAEAERTSSELSRARRARASVWSEENGQVERAVAYAQDANDPQAVAGLVLRHGMRLFAAGRVEVLNPWFDWLWSKGCRDARVAVMCAWLLLLQGQSLGHAGALLWRRRGTLMSSSPMGALLPAGRARCEPLWLTVHRRCAEKRRRRQAGWPDQSPASNSAHPAWVRPLSRGVVRRSRRDAARGRPS